MFILITYVSAYIFELNAGQNNKIKVSCVMGMGCLLVYRKKVRLFK